MNAPDRLFRMFLAAIVLIVSQFVLADAQAHVGHVNGHQQTYRKVVAAAVEHSRPDFAAQSAPVVQKMAVTDLTQETKLSIIANLSLKRTTSDADSSLAGFCEGGMICWGAALAALSTDLSPVELSARLQVENLGPIEGSVPEALRKPPRDCV